MAGGDLSLQPVGQRVVRFQSIVWRIDTAFDYVVPRLVFAQRNAHPDAIPHSGKVKFLFEVVVVENRLSVGVGRC